MTTPEMGSVTAARIGIVKSLALLAMGLLPWPVDWDKCPRRDRQRPLPELNRAEREGQAAGYYEGLIGVRRWLGLVTRRCCPSADRQPERLGPVQAGERRSLSRRRVPPIRASAIGRAHAVRPAVCHQSVRHARRPGRRREVRRHVSHRRPGLVDRDGVGRQAPGHLCQSARRVAEHAFGTDWGSRRRGGSRCSISVWRPIAPCSASKRFATRSCDFIPIW